MRILADVRAWVYARQSQDRTGDELGVSRQCDDCAELIARRGWTEARRIVDNDTTASGKRRRAGFEELLAAIDAGEVDAVVAWSLDRVTRNRRDTVRLIEAAQARGVTLALVRGSDLDLSTPAGRLTADVLASVARHEIEAKGDRQRRATAQAAAEGRRVGGRRPFGYDADGLTIKPCEADAVRKAYRDVLAGVPLGQVAREWNAAGLRSGQVRWKDGRRGKRGEPSAWTHDTVRLVLRNPRNAGLRQHDDEIVGKAAWPALVSEETWRAIEALLSAPERRSGGPGRAGQRMLTGVALCGVCGSTVHSGRGQAAARRYHIYRCAAAGGHVVRKLDPIDAFVGDVVVERLGRPDAAELLIAENRPNVGEMREQAVALRSRLDSLAVEFADGGLTASQLRIATERIRSKLAESEAALADAGRASLLGPLVRTDDVVKAWGELDDHRRRAVIEVLMIVTLHPVGRGTRTFRPETVSIEWK